MRYSRPDSASTCRLFLHVSPPARAGSWSKPCTVRWSQPHQEPLRIKPGSPQWIFLCAQGTSAETGWATFSEWKGTALLDKSFLNESIVCEATTTRIWRDRLPYLRGCRIKCGIFGKYSISIRILQLEMFCNIDIFLVGFLQLWREEYRVIHPDCFENPASCVCVISGKPFGKDLVLAGNQSHMALTLKNNSPIRCLCNAVASYDAIINIADDLN